jgi:hypothetical protein
VKPNDNSDMLSLNPDDSSHAVSWAVILEVQAFTNRALVLEVAGFDSIAVDLMVVVGVT